MKRKSKKGQLKIQQMSFMLLAVVLFFVLVALFWLVFQSRNIEKQASFLKQNQARLISEFISGSSEFSCNKDYCINTDKLMVVKDRSVYKDFWPVSYIRVRKIYPVKSKEEVECDEVNYPDCNTYNVYSSDKKSESSAGSFVALCRYEKIGGYPTQICDLGKIIIGYEVI